MIRAHIVWWHGGQREIIVAMLQSQVLIPVCGDILDVPLPIGNPPRDHIISAVTWTVEQLDGLATVIPVIELRRPN